MNSKFIIMTYIKRYYGVYYTFLSSGRIYLPQYTEKTYTMWQPNPCKKNPHHMFTDLKCSLLSMHILNNERCWKINPARLLFVPYFTLSLSWNVNKTKPVATNRGEFGVFSTASPGREVCSKWNQSVCHKYMNISDNNCITYLRRTLVILLWLFFQFLPNFLGWILHNVT